MATKTYAQLLAEACPRPIRSKAEYGRAMREVDKLMEQAKRTKDESDLLRTFVLLIEAYEAETFEPVEPVSLDQLLRHLMEVRDVSSAELARETQIPKSTVSEMLSGARGISRKNISALADYFSVSRQLFLDAPLSSSK